MTPAIAVRSGSAAQPSEIKIPQLPLREHGLTNVPAIPLDFVGMKDTLLKLAVKVKQREQAVQGLSRTITIGGSTAPAYAFLFGHEAPETKAAAALERVRSFLNRNPLGSPPAWSTRSTPRRRRWPERQRRAAMISPRVRSTIP